jgi:TrmH RNA methyltransferase
MARPPEEVVYGVNAVRALFTHRRESIRRVFHLRSRREALADVLKWCAAKRLPYREVSDEEMERIAKALHHEGVAVVAEPLATVPLERLADRPRPGDALLVLDNVGNPHNLGAILRSAASFGARGVVVRASQAQAKLSPSAVRVAQGGAEVVPVSVVTSLQSALRSLRAPGYAIVGADASSSRELFEEPLPRPVAVVLGSEGEGLSPDVAASCDCLVRIPTTGAVQSLNVSVAAGVVLAELWRTRP